MLHRIDGVTPDTIRRKWTYLILGKGFGQDDGGEFLFQFDEASSRVQLCEHQEELKQSITKDMKLVREQLRLAAMQKKQAEEQERLDSLPDRIEALEDRLEKVLSMVDEIQNELDELKGD